MNLLTIKEFAQAVKISEKLAYGMARSDAFIQQKISLDVSQKKASQKNKMWRINIDKYYIALEKGII